MRAMALLSAPALAIAAVVTLATPGVAADDVLIFAAASLSNALDAMKPLS